MIAPGNRPPHIAIATVGGIQVLGHETPGESSGAEDNHIKRFAHTQSLHDSATSAQACRGVNKSGSVVINQQPRAVAWNEDGRVPNDSHLVDGCARSVGNNCRSWSREPQAGVSGRTAAAT